MDDDKIFDEVREVDSRLFHALLVVAPPLNLRCVGRFVVRHSFFKRVDEQIHLGESALRVGQFEW